MNGKWEYRKIGEILIVKRGGSPRPIKKYLTESPDGLNWIKISDATLSDKYIYETKQKITKEGLHKTRLVNEGDFLLSNSMSFGRPYIMKTTGCIHDGWLVLRDKKEVELDKDYLYHILCSPYIFRQFDTLAAGSTVRNLNIALVSSVEIPIPPLPEQKQIVALLDQTFAAIDQAKANVEKNLQNAKELFENFLKGVFENPKDNWEKKKWGEICHFVRGPFGGSLKKSMFKEEGYVVYEQKHAIHNHFNQLRYFIDENKFKEMKRFEVKPGDIIMSCSGVTLGRVAIIPKNVRRGIINQALLKLTPNESVSVHFLKYWLRSKIFQDIIFEYSGGAAIPNVPSAKILKDILIPITSLEEQNQVVKNIDLMLSKTNDLKTAYEQKANDLKKLKKSILQKAFSGELTAKEIPA